MQRIRYILSIILFYISITMAMTMDFPLGIVEGFYDVPWSHQNRQSILKFMGENGMNFYVYAPKDDPYHRSKWREAYPDEDMKRIKELISTAKKNHVQFCFAISPGLDIKYSDSNDFSILLNKLKTMNDLGVHDFALFLDDVSDQLQYPEDKAVFSSYGEAHVVLTNKLYEVLKKWNPQNTLIFCPTEYYKITRTPYLDTIGKGINKDVPIIWTGNGVTTPTLYVDDLLKIRSILKRKPFFWENYPVNDYNRNQLYMGPILQRTPVLAKHLSGYIANPMNEAELSKIPLYTIAEYFKDPIQYSPEKAWREGIMRVSGSKAYPYITNLADNARASFLTSDNSLEMGVLVADFLENPSRENKHNLVEKLKEYRDMPELLKANLKNKQMLNEMTPYLSKLSLYGETGLLAVQVYTMDTISNNTAEWIRFKSLNKLLKTNPKSIGDMVFGKLIQAAYGKGYSLLGINIPSISALVSSFEGNVIEMAVDSDKESFYWSNKPFGIDDSIIVDYGKTTTAHKVLIFQGKVDRPDDLLINGVCELSLDGSNWFGAAQFSASDSDISINAPFRYLRIRPSMAGNKWLIIREIELIH